MNERQDKFEQLDELFSSKLGMLEIQPPSSAWRHIATELDRRSGFGHRMWWAAASIAVLAVAAGLLWYLVSPPQTGIAEKPVIAENQSATTTETIANKANQSYAESETSSTPPDKSLLILSKKKAVASDAETKQNKNRYEKNKDATAFFQSSENEIKDSENEIVEQEKSAMDISIDSTSSAKPHDSFATGKSEPFKIEGVVPIKSIEENKISSENKISDDDWNPFNEGAKMMLAKRWSVTGQMAPTVSYRDILKVPEGMRAMDFNKAETPLVAYSGGVNLAFKLHRRWSVQAGLYYVQMGQTIHNVVAGYNMYAGLSSSSVYSKNFLRTSSGVAVVSSNLKAQVDGVYSDYFNDSKQDALSTASLAPRASTNTLIEQLKYVEVPILVRYNIIDRTFGLNVVGGMGINFLIGNSVLIDNGKELIREGPFKDARPVNYNATVGLGVSYRLSSKLLIGLEPVFKYFMQTYSTNTDVTSHPYAFGFYTGLSYSF